MQIAGRSTVLWAVIEAYPVSAAGPNGGTRSEAAHEQQQHQQQLPSPSLLPFYAAMVLAWSAADAVRYLYFAARLLGGHQYPRLTWLRYSAFYALYPVGIAGEVGVVARAVAAAWARGNAGHAWAYLAAATLYVPGEIASSVLPFSLLFYVFLLSLCRRSKPCRSVRMKM